MLTLALTVVVSPTVAPEAGDVMVTIRLPPGGGSCANAWSGAIQVTLKTIIRAVAQARLMISSMDVPFAER